MGYMKNTIAKLTIRIITAWLGVFCAGVVFAADISLASWNIERLGHGQQKSYAALAQIASRFDFIAVQEVMTQEGLERFSAALEDHTGEPWEKMASHLIGRGSYKEKYAFVWRTAAIEYVDGAVVYLDTTDKFAREPYSARFRAKDSGLEFVVATVHIIYGRSRSDRTPEIQALYEYRAWLGEVYDGDPERILLGDFNLRPSHPAWGPLREVARPLIIEGASTVSSIDGRYANLYDNIWVSSDSNLPICSAGVFKAPDVLGWSHETFRQHVSDHVPVYVLLGQATLDTAPVIGLSPPGQPMRAEPNGQAYEGAVRGNRNSRIYHRPDCPSYDRVAAHNRVPFESKTAAEKAGYRLAGNCP